MGAARRGRGRLPQRVYWFRRLVVLVVVAAVVVGVAHLLGGTGADETPAADQARPAAGTPSALPPLVYGPTGPAKVARGQKGDVAPAQSTGDCDPQDITALPRLNEPEAGGDVRIAVTLAGTQPACDFEVGPDSLVVKITDADGRDFWRSQDCPEAIKREQVVVRSAEPTVVRLTWNGRSSDRGCGDFDRWALPGFFDAMVSVQGSSPAQLRFELLPPGVTYVTETPSPTATPKRDRDRDEPTPATPSASPSESSRG